MILPELPRQKKSKEADFGLRFREWMRENPQWSGAYELKQCATCLNFKAVKDHQIAALKLAKGSGLLWKIADDSRGVKPFDYFYLRGAGGYIVIKYTRCFVIIDVDIFIEEKEISFRKSLTIERALEIASYSTTI